MAGHDQAVSNLERFIGHLVQATGALQRIGGHIEETTSSLEPFGRPSGADDDLNTHLERIDSSLSSGTREAVQALGEAMRRTAEGASGLNGQRDRVERAASDLEATSKDVDGELHEAETSLVSDGFEALVQVLGALEAGVGAAADEAVKEMTAVENTCEQLQQDSQTAWDAAQSELDEGRAACEQAEDSIQGEQAKSEQSFEEQAGHLESACSAVLDQVGTLYDALETTVEAEGGEWTAALEHEHEHAAELFAQASRERLEVGQDVAMNVGMGTLSDEYKDHLSPAIFDRAGPLAESAEAIAPDVEVGRRVVPKIQKLLEALAG